MFNAVHYAWDIAGKGLTIPAFILNWAAWLEGVTVNQALTVMISIVVLLYWLGKLATMRVERQILKLELEKLLETEKEEEAE